MKDNHKLVAVLKQLLAAELEDIRDDLALSEMCKASDFERSHRALEQQALGKIQHAGQLIQRIISANGTPGITKLDLLRFGFADLNNRSDLPISKKPVSVKSRTLGLRLFSIFHNGQRANAPVEGPTSMREDFIE